MSNEKKTAIGTLVDTPIEQLRDELKNLTYGELCNLKKLVEVQYSQVTAVKDELQLELSKHLIKNTNEGAKTRDNLFKVLQKLEDIATLIEAYKKEKSLVQPS